MRGYGVPPRNTEEHLPPPGPAAAGFSWAEPPATLPSGGASVPASGLTDLFPTEREARTTRVATARCSTPARRPGSSSSQGEGPTPASARTPRPAATPPAPEVVPWPSEPGSATPLVRPAIVTRPTMPELRTGTMRGGQATRRGDRLASGHDATPHHRLGEPLAVSPQQARPFPPPTDRSAVAGTFATDEP